jgi:hypothetical protein
MVQQLRVAEMGIKLVGRKIAQMGPALTPRHGSLMPTGQKIMRTQKQARPEDQDMQHAQNNKTIHAHTKNTWRLDV